MRRFATVLALMALLAFPAAASADPGAYPGQRRADTAVFGGPHCHSIHGDTTKLAYPSHRAHVAQIMHRPSGPVFGGVAEENC